MDGQTMKVFYGLLVMLSLTEGALADDSLQLTISEKVSKDNLVGNYLNYKFDNQSGERSESEEWVMRRTQDLIAYERSKISDVWERNDVGEITYMQVYHDFLTYIEYYLADFKILEQAEPDWQQLGALLDLTAFDSLESTERYIVSDQEVTIYKGDLRGLDASVHWIAALELPARIEYRSGDITQVMELQSLYGNEDAPWPQWDSTEYFGMDFVDMGDNESHPLIQALNAGQAGGHHQH